MGRVFTVLSVVCILAVSAQAGVVTDFESGTPAGFVLFGNTGVTGQVGTGPSMFPAGGLAFLASSTGGASVTQGTGPASFFTGDPAGQGFSITEYSGFSFPLIVPVPSYLTAMLNFMTSEYVGGAPDLIAFYLDDGSGAALAGGWVVAPYTSLPALFEGLPITGFDGNGIIDATFGSFDKGQTGWALQSSEIGPGSYTAYLLVADVGDTQVDTAFAIDDLALTAIPEPTTLALFGLGLAGVSLVAWRRKRRKAA